MKLKVKTPHLLNVIIYFSLGLIPLFWEQATNIIVLSALIFLFTQRMELTRDAFKDSIKRNLFLILFVLYFFFNFIVFTEISHEAFFFGISHAIASLVTILVLGMAQQAQGLDQTKTAETALIYGICITLAVLGAFRLGVFTEMQCRVQAFSYNSLAIPLIFGPLAAWAAITSATRPASSDIKIALLLMLPVMVGGFYGGSRTLFASSILAVIVFSLAIAIIRKSSRFMLISVALLIVTITATVLMDYITQCNFIVRFTNTLGDAAQGSLGDSSSKVRFILWETVLNLSIERPIFGYGSAVERSLIEANTGYYFYAHSQYLSWLLNGGIIGLVLGLLALIQGWLTATRNAGFIGFTFMAVVPIYMGVPLLTNSDLNVTQSLHIFLVYKLLLSVANLPKVSK